MPVKMPLEPTYYYECSYGNYRLIYHLPYTILEELVSDRKISEEVLLDYPDGADINCTPAEYAVFEDSYQYKPPVEPEQLRRAFFALFSSLDLGSPWEDFKGSGYVKASRLESMGAVVEDSLRAVDDHLVEELTLPDDHSFEDLRRVRVDQVAQQAEVKSTLQEISLDLVTREFASDLPPTRQSLVPEMDDGEAPEEIFSRAQKK